MMMLGGIINARVGSICNYIVICKLSRYYFSDIESKVEKDVEETGVVKIREGDHLCLFTPWNAHWASERMLGPKNMNQLHPLNLEVKNTKG